MRCSLTSKWACPLPPRRDLSVRRLSCRSTRNRSANCPCLPPSAGGCGTAARAPRHQSSQRPARVLYIGTRYMGSLPPIIIHSPLTRLASCLLLPTYTANCVEDASLRPPSLDHKLLIIEYSRQDHLKTTNVKKPALLCTFSMPLGQALSSSSHAARTRMRLAAADSAEPERNNNAANLVARYPISWEPESPYKRTNTAVKQWATAAPNLTSHMQTRLLLSHDVIPCSALEH